MDMGEVEKVTKVAKPVKGIPFTAPERRETPAPERELVPALPKKKEQS